MISVLSTNITSPLGFTTEQNYQAVRAGHPSLRRYDGLWGLTEPFAASLFSEEQRAALALDGYTFFEALAIHSVREALSHIQLDVASPRVILILSTTKGNIGQSPAEAAQKIAKVLGVSTTPIVVCNACVSGLSAQLLADRLLSASLYDYAIVVGAEEQSKFIISGFQSLKAVSEEPCRPFDIERNGLNPGEAAATIIFGKMVKQRSTAVPPAPDRREVPPAPDRREEGKVNGQATLDGQRESQWSMVQGAVCNDAYHNVSPSPKAEGCAHAIEQAMAGWDKSRLATVCVHGTATLFNDQMESIAIQKTGLSEVPLSALKGYFGHTMGAAGVLETILTMCATDDGVVLPSKGFTEVGVSGKVSISKTPLPILGENKNSFLKLLSGFGGCNVAVLYTKDPPSNARRLTEESTLFSGRNKESLAIKGEVWRGSSIRISSQDGKKPVDIYKQQIGDYPKFYKMDILSQLAFVAAEQLKKSLPLKGEVEGVCLFNHSSSIVADRQFLSTISDAENFTDALAPWRADKARIFPSPSVFVYTLPNIAAGEIAIRHHVTGETSFYILPKKDEALMQQILEATINATGAKSVVSGWVDAESKTNYECELSVYNYTSK